MEPEKRLVRGFFPRLHTDLHDIHRLRRHRQDDKAHHAVRPSWFEGSSSKCGLNPLRSTCLAMRVIVHDTVQWVGHDGAHCYYRLARLRFPPLLKAPFLNPDTASTIPHVQPKATQGPGSGVLNLAHHRVTRTLSLSLTRAYDSWLRRFHIEVAEMLSRPTHHLTCRYHDIRPQ